MSSLSINLLFVLFIILSTTIAFAIESVASQPAASINVPEENSDMQFKTTGNDDSQSAEFTYDGQRLVGSPSALPPASEWDAATAAAAGTVQARKKPWRSTSTSFNMKETLPLVATARIVPAGTATLPRKRVGVISEFEEEAEPDKVCRGTNQGLSYSNNITQHYRQLRSNFDNCVYVDGNLEITFLNDQHDLSFLSTIREVTGYVLIARLDRVKLELPRLRVIRGRQLFTLSSSEIRPSFRYGLFVLDNRKLLKLDLHNLVEVVRGDIGLQNNPQACYLPTIQWRDMLGSDNATVDVDFKTSASGLRPWCENKGHCHYQCKERCWAEDLFSCQTLSKLECSKQCENGRCFGVGATQCCHPQCIGGCTGPTSRECIACRYFNNDGTCVSECPPIRIYDPNSYQWRQNADGKVAHGVQCVADCPNGLLTDDNACVRQCPSHKRELNGTCVPCEAGKCRRHVCQGSQHHGPGWQMFINAKNINQFRNCTAINGNLVILQSTFEEYGIFDDDRSHLPLVNGRRGQVTPEVLQPLRPEQLSILETVHEVHGYVNIEGAHPKMTSLSFLKNLRIIHGRQTLNGTALQVLKNDYLTSLGLNNLERIVNGGVIIYSNPNLCYTKNISWPSIVTIPSSSLRQNQAPPQQRLASLMTSVSAMGDSTDTPTALQLSGPVGPRILVAKNADYDVCTLKGLVCHSQCDPDEGCWGPLPEQCEKCIKYKYQDKCVEACNAENGMYFESRNNTCMACDEECSGGCFKAGSDNCVKCQNVKDGPYCVTHCPEGKYADAWSFCQKCNETCANGCTGPSSFVGKDGCNSCDVGLQNATSSILSKYNYLLLARGQLSQYQSRAGDDHTSLLATSVLLHNNKPGLIDLSHHRDYDDLDNENEDILEANGESSSGVVRDPITQSNPGISIQCLAKGSTCPNGTFGQFQPFIDESSLTELEKRDPLFGLRVALAGKRVCKPCHPLCLECTEISLDCGRCRVFRQSGVCVSKCSPDYYAEKMPREALCLPCDDNCDGCDGPGPTRCSSCRRFRVYIDGSDGFNCTDKCPADKSVVITQQDSPNAICVDSSHPAAIQASLAKRNTTMVIIFFVVVALIVLIFCVFCLARQCKQRAKANRKALEFVVKLNEQSPDEPLQESGAPPNTNKMEIIAENDLHRIKMIGSGAFGTVYKGEWTPAGRAGLKVKVAIKVLHDATSASSAADDKEQNEFHPGKFNPLSQRKNVGPVLSDASTKMSNAQTEFIEEAYVMASMKHPSLVPLLGVCLAKEPQLVTTLMEQGCLLNYLREHQNQLGSKMMLNWAVQIAKGMLYLEQHRLVHRDLAARNVLLQSPSVCRITDFGLSKLLDVNELEYRAGGGKMPVKWMAIESLLHRIFTHKSDVWSYGVTIWEILMFGEMPYRGLLNRDIPELIAAGERLSQPQTSSLDIYTIMMRCWLPDPHQRPNFTQLVEMFSRMARDPRRYLIVEADRYLRESSSTSQTHSSTTSASSPGGPLSSPAPLVPGEGKGDVQDPDDDDEVIGGSSEMLNSEWPSVMGSARRVRTISTLARDKQQNARFTPNHRTNGGNFSPNKYAEMLAMQVRNNNGTPDPNGYGMGSIKYAQLLLSASRMENAEKSIDSPTPPPQLSAYQNSAGRPYYIRPAIHAGVANGEYDDQLMQQHSAQVHENNTQSALPVDHYNYLLPVVPSQLRSASSNAGENNSNASNFPPIINSSPTTISVPWLAISTSPYATATTNNVSRFMYNDDSAAKSGVKDSGNSKSALAYTMNIANALYDGLMNGGGAATDSDATPPRAEHHSTSTMRTSLVSESPVQNQQVMDDDVLMTSSSSPTRSSLASNSNSSNTSGGAAANAPSVLARANTAPAVKTNNSQPHRGVSTFVGSSNNNTPVSSRRSPPDEDENVSVPVIMRQHYRPKSSAIPALKLVNANSTSENGFNVAINPCYHNLAFDTESGSISTKSVNRLGLTINPAETSSSTSPPDDFGYRTRNSSERTPLDPGAQPLSPLQPALSPSVFVVEQSLFNGLHNENGVVGSLTSVRRASLACRSDQPKSPIQQRLSNRNMKSTNGHLPHLKLDNGSLRREETAV